MMEDEVLRRYLGLEAENELVIEAWRLFIETQRAYRDVDRGRLSRREGDNVRRRFIRHMKQHRLKAWDDEAGLPRDELAVAGEGTPREDLRSVDSLDIRLLVDFEDLCAAWLADDPRTAEAFPEAFLAFYAHPLVDQQLKERLIEKDKERGERLLKALLEARPDAVIVHQLLVEHHERAGQFAEAEADYQRMLAENESEREWANYGEFLEHRGRYEEAFNAYKTSLAYCERLGEAGEEFGRVLTKHISRVERMKNLTGEDARKARAFWEALFLLAEIRLYAERAFEAELAKAEEEYREEHGRDKLSLAEVFEFLNWFLFTRPLTDGRTPGLVYADDKGLSDELKARLQGLGRPLKGAFEVLRADPATFTLIVKDRKTGAEYELRVDAPELKAGATFEASLLPWGEFYLTSGIVRSEEEEASSAELV
jgi:tetratricopeptide (TPR) repeat protein